MTESPSAYLVSHLKDNEAMKEAIEEAGLCPKCLSDDTGTARQYDASGDLTVCCSRCYACNHDWNFA